MKSRNIFSLLVLMVFFASSYAQQLTQGTVAYYEAMRISYQTKINWVLNHPEEHVQALSSGWYDMANANVQQMEEYKTLAAHSPDGIYIPDQNRSMNTNPEPGGDLCDLAAPFCSSAGAYTFACGTSGASAEVGPDYGCLYSQPNAAWYYLEIETSGVLTFDLTAPSDIDFIIWGPFVGSCGNPICDYSLLSDANIIDCSFLSTQFETPEIGPGSSGGAVTATAGEFYMFLITNYSGQTQDFTLEQTNVGQAGAGSTSCDCVTCGLDAESLTVTVGDCEPHQDAQGNFYSEYDISGSVNIIDPSDPNIDSIAYFIDGVWFMSQIATISNPNTYSFDNLSADGNLHTITVTMYLSDGSNVEECSQEIEYLAPDNCAQCAAVAGPDITECGEQIVMGASVDVSDYNTYWTPLCSNVAITNMNDPNTQVSYTGGYTNGQPVSCELIWNITNFQNLTCSDTATITFQPIPSAEFNLTDEVCDEDTVDADVINAANIPITTYDWTFASATEVTGTLNEHIELVFNNAVGSNQVCLQVTSDLGCQSTNHCEATEVKQVPTADFTIGGSICHDGTTTVTYSNNNSPQIPCPDFGSWDFGSAISVTGGTCVYNVTAQNFDTDSVYYPIELEVDYNGCTSEPFTDSLLVYSQGVSECCTTPEAYAGEDTALCGLEYVLDASIGGSGNHGEWVYVTGPNVTFFPSTTPNSHIIVDGPGDLVIDWVEINGECSDTDQVVITFIEQPNITFSQEDYAICGDEGVIEAVSSVNPGTDFQWLNNTSAVFSSETVFNPSVDVDGAYGIYIFDCVGTVDGQCSDTSEVKVTFIEPPVCDAGPGGSPCGTLDTLHAVSTHGGYWSVASSPAGGTNCSAIFTPDIYDPNAVVSVTCEGSWTFVWTEVNGICESSCSVEINFSPNSIALTTIPVPRTCYDYAQVAVDTTGYGNDTWIWTVDPDWDVGLSVLFSPYDPKPIITKDFSDEAFGDSGYVEIPFIVTLISGGCASTEPSSVTFYQRPEPFVGRDTMVCDDHIEIDVEPTIPVSVSEQIWYDNDHGGAYDAVPNDSYSTVINANLGDSLYLVFSEENTLGNNHPSCLVHDTILVEFLKRPTADAGDNEYHICGNCIQLEASLDNSVNSVGRWLINSEGFYGYDCQDNNSTAVADTNAWFYHSTDINPGVDTIYLHWMEFNAKMAQCHDIDSVPVYFWYQDTAYIKLNGTLSDVDSTCGRVYENISGNDTLPNNPYSGQYWLVGDSNPVEWFYNGSAGAVTEPQLDSIQVVSIGQQDHVWRDIYFIIENGDIYGSDPAVCVDTSMKVSIRFDNPVIAEIAESYSYPEPFVVCGDTTCLTATSIFDWSHVNWITNDYAYFQDGYSGDRADTLIHPCLVAPTGIYPDADTITGGDTHNRIIMEVRNGMCIAYDTINVRWAPIPSGTFEIEQPPCAGDAAELTVNRDIATGFDKHITDIEWIFEDDDEPTSIVAINSTQDTIHVAYANSSDNEDFKHAVSVQTRNIWGCTYRIYPPDTIYEPFPSYVEWIDEEHPTCGECDGLLSFRNYSDNMNYSVVWATNKLFNNSTDDIISNGDTITIDELCTSTYYLKVTYPSIVIGNCNDTLVFNLHADSSTVASSDFEFLVDTTGLQVPFELDMNSISNTSLNANKYTWQVFNGTEEDLALMVWEGYDEIPEYIFSNSGEYLVKLQAFNDKAPNCPAMPVDMTIFVHYESVLEVPNVFTPNGDLLNDEFRVKARELATYKCIVYNRWGDKVFETEDPTEAWNGKKDNSGSDLSSGSYFYVITGTGKKGQDFEFKGAVQLLREK